MPPPLVLASASPRRSALLTMLGLHHQVLPTALAEQPLQGESPDAYVERLAREKAMAAAALRPDALVLGGDTEVVLDGAVLGKPSDRAEAAAMLLRLAGRAHTVLSGLALVAPGGAVFTSLHRTVVRFRPFGADWARAYAATGEPLDKAGAYGIQGLGAALVEGIEGDYYTVVGLPVVGVLRLLERAGWRYAFGALLPVPPAERAGGERAAHAPLPEP